MALTWRTSALADRHRALGSALEDWNGMGTAWTYRSDVQDDHVAIRTRAGLMDVSGLKKLHLVGPHAAAILDRVTTRNVEKITPGRSVYAAMLNDGGKFIEDCILYRTGPNAWMVVHGSASCAALACSASMTAAPTGRWSGSPTICCRPRTVRAARVSGCGGSWRDAASWPPVPSSVRWRSPTTIGLASCSRATTVLLAVFASSALAQPASKVELGPPGQLQATTGIVRTTEGSVMLTAGRRVTFTVEAGSLAVSGTDVSNAAIGGAPDVSEGDAIARMSYVAYFAQEGVPARRPILFLWDGGPGASSRGLVVTSFGPVRVAVPQPRDALPAPPPLIVNNADCLLDVADLVFVDAPGTGFGHIAGRDAARRFYSIDGDAAAFARFIEQFLTSNAREGSPIYLFGHSYGTMRSPVVARRLAGDGMPPHGIISVSQWLNNDENVDAAPANPGTDNAYIDALPSYAAIAWYHHRLRDRPPSLAPVLARTEAFALDDYAAALLAGSVLPTARKHAIAATLEDLTGVPAGVWLKADLRIDGAAFRRLVLNEPDRTVGRLDARYLGMVTDPLESRVDNDPFGAATSPTIAAAGAQYEREVIGFGRTVAFAADADVPDLRWDEYHSTDGKTWDSFYNVIPDLAKVMTEAPGMRFLMMNGYYDLGTTYLGAVEDLRHLPIPIALQSNIQTTFYETGHEPYIEDNVRHDMHDQIARFIRP